MYERADPRIRSSGRPWSRPSWSSVAETFTRLNRAYQHGMEIKGYISQMQSGLAPRPEWVEWGGSWNTRKTKRDGWARRFAFSTEKELVRFRERLTRMQARASWLRPVAEADGLGLGQLREFDKMNWKGVDDDFLRRYVGECVRLNKERA